MDRPQKMPRPQSYYAGHHVPHSSSSYMTRPQSQYTQAQHSQSALPYALQPRQTPYFAPQNASSSYGPSAYGPVANSTSPYGYTQSNPSQYGGPAAAANPYALIPYGSNPAGAPQYGPLYDSSFHALQPVIPDGAEDGPGIDISALRRLRNTQNIEVSSLIPAVDTVATVCDEVSRNLYLRADRARHPKDEIQSTAAELAAFSMVLENLHDALESSAQMMTVRALDNANQIILSCKNVLQSIEKTIEPDKKLATRIRNWRGDTLNSRLMKAKSIRLNLESCKTTLMVLLSTTRLAVFKREMSESQKHQSNTTIALKEARVASRVERDILTNSRAIVRWQAAELEAQFPSSYPALERAKSSSFVPINSQWFADLVPFKIPRPAPYLALPPIPETSSALDRNSKEAIHKTIETLLSQWTKLGDEVADKSQRGKNGKEQERKKRAADAAARTTKNLDLSTDANSPYGLAARGDFLPVNGENKPDKSTSGDTTREGRDDPTASTTNIAAGMPPSSSMKKGEENTHEDAASNDGDDHVPKLPVNVDLEADSEDSWGAWGLSKRKGNKKKGKTTHKNSTESAGIHVEINHMRTPSVAGEPATTTDEAPRESEQNWNEPPNEVEATRERQNFGPLVEETVSVASEAGTGVPVRPEYIHLLHSAPESEIDPDESASRVRNHNVHLPVGRRGRSRRTPRSTGRAAVDRTQQDYDSDSERDQYPTETGLAHSSGAERRYAAKSESSGTGIYHQADFVPETYYNMPASTYVGGATLPTAHYSSDQLVHYAPQSYAPYPGYASVVPPQMQPNGNSYPYQPHAPTTYMPPWSVYPTQAMPFSTAVEQPPPAAEAETKANDYEELIKRMEAMLLAQGEKEAADRERRRADEEEVQARRQAEMEAVKAAALAAAALAEKVQEKQAKKEVKAIAAVEAAAKAAAKEREEAFEQMMTKLKEDQREFMQSLLKKESERNLDDTEEIRLRPNRNRPSRVAGDDVVEVIEEHSPPPRAPRLRHRGRTRDSSVDSYTSLTRSDDNDDEIDGLKLPSWQDVVSGADDKWMRQTWKGELEVVMSRAKRNFLLAILRHGERQGEAVLGLEREEEEELVETISSPAYRRDCARPVLASGASIDSRTARYLVKGPRSTVSAPGFQQNGGGNSVVPANVELLAALSELKASLQGLKAPSASSGDKQDALNGVAESSPTLLWTLEDAGPKQASSDPSIEFTCM